MLGCSRADAQESRVQVEGRGQRRHARVIDNIIAGQNLNLLPPMELFSQSSGHFSQSLSAEVREKER